MPNRRLWIAVAITVILLIATATVMVQVRSSGCWQQMQDRVAQLEVARSGFEYRRTPLWGTETDEPAYGHYDRALVLADELGETAHEELMAVMRVGAQGTHSTESVRQDWQPVLTALRRGAHAVDATQTVTAFTYDDTGVPDLLVCRRVVLAAVIEARMLRQTGSYVEAVRVTLDAATFANDMAQRGLLMQQMTGTVLTAAMITESWPEQALAELDAQGLDLLAAGMAQLEQRMPMQFAFDENLIYCARELAEEVADPTINWLIAWRYGWSVRWMVADGVAEVSAAMDRLKGPEASWLVREQVLEREYGKLQRSSNPIVKIVCANTITAERNLRRTLAQVRMLRIAIELHRGQKPQPMRDPLGDGLLVIEMTTDGCKILSRGEGAGKPLERNVQVTSGSETRSK